MKLRQASSAADAGLIEELAGRCWRPHYTPIIGDAQVDYMLAKFQSAAAVLEQIAGGRDYRLIENEAQPLGYLATDLEEDHLFLSKLYVLPQHQGCGIGRWAIEQLVGRHPGLAIRLTVNIHNLGTIAFYEQVGFIKDGPLVTDIGAGYVMDDWMMVRRPHLQP